MVDIRSYRDLIVWQKAMSLATETYRLSRLLPREEEYRLTSQMLRAAASVPANIAEGHGRGTRKDYAKFVSIARGSLAELETFILLALDVKLLAANQTMSAMSLAEEVSKMLAVLLKRLRASDG